MLHPLGHLLELSRPGPANFDGEFHGAISVVGERIAVPSFAFARLRVNELGADQTGVERLNDKPVQRTNVGRHTPNASSQSGILLPPIRASMPLPSAHF